MGLTVVIAREGRRSEPSMLELSKDGRLEWSTLANTQRVEPVVQVFRSRVFDVLRECGFGSEVRRPRKPRVSTIRRS